MATLGEFPPEKGRYQLYISLACPWANSCLNVLILKGLQEFVDVAVVHPHMVCTLFLSPTQKKVLMQVTPSLRHFDRVLLDGHSTLLFEERMASTPRRLERPERMMESKVSLETLCMMPSLFASFISRSRRIILEGKIIFSLVMFSRH